MPIHERDPWRRGYFTDIPCPSDVHIPTDDADSYRWNPMHRWVFNKLIVAESQQLECAPHGLAPTHYPVFSKPIFNLDGMGVGSRVLRDARDYERHRCPGHMWMPLLEGDHISTDAAVIAGSVRWIRHSKGVPHPGGTFDYWIVEGGRRPELETYCVRWIQTHLADYTGMVNLESIGGRIIEVHLRFTDQWPDLYGAGWLVAMVLLYAQRQWDFSDRDRRDAFSVPLFGPHGHRYLHPDPDFVTSIRALPDVSSVQITFHEDRPPESHAMPPGGFRLAIVNCWDLHAGIKARTLMAEAFGLQASTAAIRGQRTAL
jgi:hypothetical protein